MCKCGQAKFQRNKEIENKKSVTIKNQPIKFRTQRRNYKGENRKLTNHNRMANKHRKMIVLKSGIFLMFVLIEKSTQFSISSEVNSELPSSNQTGCSFKTIGQCLRLRAHELGTCAVEHALNNLDCFIGSNKTWHVNEFIALRKNEDWQPTEIEARQDQSLFEMALGKLQDLIASRSVQFTLPQINELTAEGRVKSGFDYGGLVGFATSGKKKSEDQNFLFSLN